ncbi:hypothetical protein J7E83_15485 [Arthrobacter sp. ISL-48]|uniref:hypothetical protein n=1 Tax=Arthrobacter sp. ISL-48 TaxID=2819110 RepID=UPI001BED1E17|nr:hypothetical protein [Arthrobacter sp. ISL-48]MBT2533495.1 hypothetical protein [Arthrobacter sp. ISL-48]
MGTVSDRRSYQDKWEAGPMIDAHLASALQMLDGTGLPWLLLRGENDLARPSGDVDLLVSKELLPELDELFEGVGFCRVVAAGHGSHRFYFCYSSGGDFWLKLDIVSDITFGPYQQWRTSLAQRCLRHRVRGGMLWLPAPEDQAWLQLLHLMLDKGEIAPPRIDIARNAVYAASVDDSIAHFVDRRMGPGTASQLLNMIRSERFEEVPAMAARMRAGWAGTSASPWLLAIRNRCLRLPGPRLRGRGPVVGVMAPDGAGKTTLLHGLSAAFPLPIKYVYMGMWGVGPWDSLIRKIPGGRSAKKVFRAIRGGLAARYHRLRGRLVLMDRVAYDVLLSGSADAGMAGKVTDAVALRMGPKPDVLLVLDAPGEVMFARKGEHSVEILESWRQSYLRLADRLPGAHVLNADRSQDLVRRHAAGIVWGSITPGGRESKDGDGVSSAALPLNLWTLLDWRFLLPVLEPRSVGYGGKISGDLKSALHMLDPRATLIRSGNNGTSGNFFDVVLLSAPDLRLFEAAAATVEPGGWMCARVRRSLLNRSGPRTLKGWQRTFSRNGFTDVGVDWHVPSLERPTRIVPVASAIAISDTLSLHKDVRFGKAKAIAGHLALALRLVDLAVPEGTVTGRRPQGGESHEVH